MIRVLFLGTPELAVPSLASLLESSQIHLVGVITQPDRPAGRGQRLTSPPIKRLALQHGLPLLQPGRIRDNREAHEFARQVAPDVMAVVAFGQILPASFFKIPPHGTLNVHLSLLPRYRGAAPVVYTLLNGDRETGVTVMEIDQGMDTGDILAVKKVPVDPNVTAGELSRELSHLGGSLLAETIPRWVAGEVRARPQDESLATYAPRLDKSMAPVDWKRAATAVHNQIRAFNPWPGARASLRGEPIKLWRSRNPSPQRDREAPPGTILEVADDALKVACGEDTDLELVQLQPPSRRRMSARDFVNGRQIRPGERFDVSAS